MVTAESGNNLKNIKLIEDIKNATKKGKYRRSYQTIAICVDTIDIAQYTNYKYFYK